MKKFVAFILILLGMIMMTGCTSYSSKKFNNLKFDELLTNKEKTELIKNVKENFIKFSKVNIVEESQEKHGRIDNSEKTEITLFAYSNYYVTGEAQVNNSYSKEGISYKQHSKVKLDIWNNTDKKAIIYKEAVDGEDPEFNIITTYNEETEEVKNNVYNFVLNMVLGYIQALENYDAYKLKNGGYAFAKSNYDETFTPVNWVNEIKERHTLDESQVVVVVNEKYELTEITVYEASSTNRDTDTNEWYSDTRKISSKSLSIEVFYKTRKEKTDSISSLNSAYNEYLNNLNKKGDE